MGPLSGRMQGSCTSQGDPGAVYYGTYENGYREDGAIDHSIQGNRLYESADGSVELAPRSIGHVIGEHVLAPTVDVVKYCGSSFFGFLGRCFEQIENFQLLPGAAATTFTVNATEEFPLSIIQNVGPTLESAGEGPLLLNATGVPRGINFISHPLQFETPATNIPTDSAALLDDKRLLSIIPSRIALIDLANIPELSVIREAVLPSAVSYYPYHNNTRLFSNMGAGMLSNSYNFSVIDIIGVTTQDPDLVSEPLISREFFLLLPSSLDRISSYVVQGHMAYVVMEHFITYDAVLYSINLIQPENIFLAGSMSVIRSSLTDCFVVDGNNMAWGGTNSSAPLMTPEVVEIYGLHSNSTLPVLRGTIHNLSNLKSFRLHKDLLFVCTETEVRLYDISNEPNHLSSYAISLPKGLVVKEEPDGKLLACFLSSSKYWILDYTVPSTPKVVTTILAPTSSSFKQAVLGKDHIFMIDGSLQVSYLRPTYELVGTPGGGTAGLHRVNITALGSGANASTAVISMVFNIKPVITVSSLPSRYGVRGAPLEIATSGAFTHLGGRTLTFELVPPLPGFVMEPDTGVITNSAPSNLGPETLRVRASDSLGATRETTLQVVFIHGPTLRPEIEADGVPKTFARIGERYVQDLSGIYNASDGNPLNLEVRGLPISHWLEFDNTSISGTPSLSDTETLRLTFAVADGVTGIQRSIGLVVDVVTNLPPFAKNPSISMRAVLDNEAEKLLPSDLALDIYGDKAQEARYAYSLADDIDKVPSWLKLTEAEQRKLIANPRAWLDVLPFFPSPIIVSLVVRSGSLETKINVEVDVRVGKWGPILYFGGLLSGLAVSGIIFGIRAPKRVEKVRACFYNCFCTSRYQQQTIDASKGQPFQGYSIVDEMEEAHLIGEIEIFDNKGNLLPKTGSSFGHGYYLDETMTVLKNDCILEDTPYDEVIVKVYYPGDPNKAIFREFTITHGAARALERPTEGFVDQESPNPVFGVQEPSIELVPQGNTSEGASSELPDSLV